MRASPKVDEAPIGMHFASVRKPFPSIWKKSWRLARPRRQCHSYLRAACRNKAAHGQPSFGLKGSMSTGNAAGVDQASFTQGREIAP